MVYCTSLRTTLPIFCKDSLQISWQNCFSLQTILTVLWQFALRSTWTSKATPWMTALLSTKMHREHLRYTTLHIAHGTQNVPLEQQGIEFFLGSYFQYFNRLKSIRLLSQSLITWCYFWTSLRRHESRPGIESVLESQTSARSDE